jgi:coenzyme PQQ precursor peptide PqqA
VAAFAMVAVAKRHRRSRFMKIMRLDSWPPGYRAAGGTPTMAPGMTLSRLQEMHMKWQTPQAQDMRLGFEITMYVAAR